ncbi:hypothetical protein [Mycolicibacterium hodleri]|uniref:Uncharacterized protein n=1 Tax=Mycolicibacterium hodleri TaxID=49897 RepID=A0A502EGW4_9MYCO|nr:hypothetical protein [Mycolicibacterium hodleri]TPG36938.1 hypothetical protein EAH80_03360 [Mycolicibacterium hodleri]
MTPVEYLVIALALGAVGSCLHSAVRSLLSFRRSGRRQHHPRIALQVKNPDGSTTTAVLTGVNDSDAEQLIRKIENQAARVYGGPEESS